MRRVATLDRLQDDGALGEAADGGSQAVESAGGEDGFLAPEIADDALLGAPILPDGLHQIEVGVAVDAFLANKHDFSIGVIPHYASKISLSRKEFSTTHF